MRIALATCADLPSWEVDDQPLHRTLTADGFHVGQPVWNDPTVDWGAFDACVIRTTWDYTERLTEFREWLDRVSRATRLWNPATVAAWNIEKTYLRELATRGARIVPTVWIERGHSPDLRTELHSLGWKRAFLKPVVGASARGTLPIRGEADLATAQAHLERASQASGMMLQPYFDRVETEGEFSAIFVDRALTHCVRKIPVPGDYRVQDDHGARDERVTLEPTDAAWAHSVLDCVQGDLLYARVDFLRDREGQPHLVEFEALEPSLFFRHGPQAARAISAGLRRRLGAPGRV
ncbi:MAG: RimK family alpha-L-glutamate ligase [Planctomycetota bacterium]